MEDTISAGKQEPIGISALLILFSIVQLVAFVISNLKSEQNTHTEDIIENLFQPGYQLHCGFKLCKQLYCIMRRRVTRRLRDLSTTSQTLTIPGVDSMERSIKILE